MSGFKGFTNDPNKDGNVRFDIAEVSKLSDIKTMVDRLVDEYGIDSKAIE